jgi:hypothetical protein
MEALGSAVPVAAGTSRKRDVFGDLNPFSGSTFDKPNMAGPASLELIDGTS